MGYGAVMSEQSLTQRALAQEKAQAAAAAYAGGNFALAESLFQEAALADPALPAHRCNLALARLAQGKHEQAASELARAMDPLEALDCATLGFVCKISGATQEAANWLKRALLIDPAQSQARINLANLLTAEGRHDEAIRLMREGLAETPGDWRLANNLGLALHESGDPLAAVPCFEQALAQMPGRPEVTLNLAHSLLLAGRWREGFAAYEARPVQLPPASAPGWDGRPAPDKVLLVRAEQGYGDAIHFARFLPLARAKVGRLILSCDRALMPLMTCLCDTTDESQPPPAHDLCCNLLSLPFLLGLEGEALFGSVPYLPQPADRPLEGDFKVGFVWAGRAGHANDKNRSLDPALLEPLAKMAGITPISLQIGKGAAPFGMVDLSSGIGDLYHTAAFIAALDLLISVDTAPAHLAGAMGKPVWTLLPFAPDWRWGLASDTTPWYPSMRLWRQDKPGDWAGVIGKVAKALETSARSGNPNPS